MKLYIKEKVFSWGDKFHVKDENGPDRYYAVALSIDCATEAASSASNN